MPYLRPHLADRHHAHTVFKNLVEGALLVTLVLFLFLGNFRAGRDRGGRSFRCRCSATFIGLTIKGIPANLLSLGAMDFGIIVDGAVIVVENIFRRAVAQREQRRREPFKRDHCEAAVAGRAADVLLDADHHRRAHPDLHAAAPRGPDLRADGVHGHVGADRLAALLADAGAAAAACTCCGKSVPREGELARATAASASYAPVLRAGAGAPDGRRARGAVVALVGSLAAGAAARHRIPARAERGRDLGEPHAAAGHLASSEAIATLHRVRHDAAASSRKCAR